MAYRELRQSEGMLTRSSPFAYRCAGCGICCHEKAIRVSPFEILLLARQLGLTTTDFIERHTEAGGTVLRRHDEAPGRPCIFLSGNACTVHVARPLVCRLYPLGRRVSEESLESFVRLTPEPGSAGAYGDDGTVGAFLEHQDVEALIDVGARYAAFHARLVERLVDLDPGEIERRAERRAEVDELPFGQTMTSLIDIDATVDDFCRRHGRRIPADAMALVHMHLDALDEWLDGPTTSHSSVR